ncbi:MAG: hypothetical protein D6725_02385 [Planctomycetota bacterium]|nr:MAG: hypothetical protein D6725_02385 [Planctomycetota bacterium]
MIGQQLRGLLALTERSLRVDARQWRQHFVRGALLVVLMFVVWANAAELSYRSAVGQQLFAYVMFANLLCLTFVGGVYFASSISEEKDEDTLGLLKMAGLSPLAILSGKTVPRLVNVLLLVLVQMPLTMLCITLGGVGLEQVVAAHVALAAYAALLAGVGVLISVLAPGTRNATGAMGTLLAAWMLGVPLLQVLASGLGWNRAVPFVGTLQAVCSAVLTPNPFYRMSEICRPTFSGGWWSPQVLWSVVVAGGAFVAAWAGFERVTRLQQRGTERISLRFRLLSLFRRKELRRPPVGRAWKWALAWKDFYFMCGGWRQLIWKGVAFLLLVGGLEGLFLYVWSWSSRSGPTFEDAQQTLSTIAIGVGLAAVAVELPVLVSRVFQEEVRFRTLQPLLLLPQSVGALIRQKLSAVAMGIVPGLGVLLLGLLILRPADRLELFRALLGPELAYVFAVLSSYVAMVVLAARLALQLRWGTVPIAFVVVYFVLWPMGTLFGHAVGIAGRDEEFMVQTGLGFCILAVVLGADFVRRLAGMAARD